MSDEFELQPELCETCQGELIISDVLIYPGETFSWELLDEGIIQERADDPEAEWMEFVCCPQCGYIYENTGNETDDEQREER